MCRIHQKSSGIKGPLHHDLVFRCTRCLGMPRPVQGRTVKEVKVGLEKVSGCHEFLLFRGHALCWRCLHLSLVKRCKCAWDMFRQLLPLLNNRSLPVLTTGLVYSSCVRSAMLHASGIWGITIATQNRCGVMSSQ